MARTNGKGSGDTRVPEQNNEDTNSEKQSLQPSNTNSPQQHATQRAGNISTDSLDSSGMKPAGQERQMMKELSPLRPQFTASARGTSRSRKNSQDLSPTRNPINAFSHPVPSAAAVQRALSANKPPPQMSVIDNTSEIRTSKSSEPTPRWPVSPRLTSPPPSSNIPRNPAHSIRRQDSDMAAPNSSQKRLSAPALDLSLTAGKLLQEKEDNNTPRSALKTPARGVSGVAPTLETVVESSVPHPPLIIEPSERSTVESPEEYGDSHNDELPDAIQPGVSKGSGDSESDSGGSKVQTDSLAKLGTTDGRSSSTLAKKSLTNIGTAKGKVPEPPTRSMTVETETVSSVPQATLSVAGDRNASGKLDANGSLRLKASNETMKPKKEKRKNARRPTSINTGTISSKADIFEAKVASAVDEANSSDSDETFVYESNPPESYVPRSARHHSRTPSATSLASQVDQYGARNKSNGKDGQHSIAGKRSMKFANYNTNFDGEYGSQGNGRGGGRMVSTPRHHHISRHSRGQGHAGLFDNESPFIQASKPSSPRVQNGRSRPNSPRFIGSRTTSSPRKAEAYMWDADEGVADDERMPLIGSVRINRGRHVRKPINGSLRQIDYIQDDRRGFFSRHGACFLVTILLLALCICAGSSIVLLSRPLVDVSIKEIKNVLATEQELMFDLNVRATNPNLFAITVSDLNVDIFAKSGFAGNDVQLRQYQSPPLRRRLRWSRGSHLSDDTPRTVDGVDEGNDPIEDPGSDPQTMVLGRVFEFDSPLIFESSPIRRQSTLSLGEIRLTRPGNKTEEGGSARWERVIQHPFELIIGGAVRYQLPLSSRIRSASVRAKMMVDPKDAEDARPSHVPNKQFSP